MEKWNIEEECGYKPITTFWEDFSIADKFGIKAVEETFDRAFKEWKNDYKYLTELVMVLNWKIWKHYETNKSLAEVYNELWRLSDTYAYSHLKGKKLSYFLKITD